MVAVIFGVYYICTYPNCRRGVQGAGHRAWVTVRGPQTVGVPLLANQITAGNKTSKTPLSSSGEMRQTHTQPSPHHHITT